ncbi:XXYS1_4_G0001090.mRNA.1.CDS.1 [Saccharomyces cerevisiae]|nr:EM14S01-3B_G0054700.mRNA.1.CDS.1 [Saccharomyces cerevisiae]CAD6629705.1 XXYS1_4_G0001090.mRNA.1.CDS.1 [Saccharomyces cerevisiae]CAI4517206.1 AMH_1a_G0023780.mRNA.1.CDS.1 [Saccharomyces cerevisiae]CAI4524647.1 CEI_1a_G0023700.mRNA.1.CDS.1 [Saccharomyces cerevisiae]CAI6705780.1 AMH_1a_G0023780.mRNA.1.CDS.1 [Saccharomyces cerevisiae]
MNVTPLDELQWKSPEWIQVFGLRTENVLDYFAESPFFDKTSNNQVIKMQRQFSQLNDPNAAVNMTQNIMALPDGKNGNLEEEFAYVDPARRQILFKYPMYMQLEEELMKLDGTEYVLSSVREPDFWVIRKQRRTNNSGAGSSKGPEIIPLQDYYIIGANVYQSPTIFKIVQSRLMSTSYHLNSTLESLYDLIEFQPSQGVHYKVPTDTSTTATAATNGNNAGGGSNKSSVRPTGGANMATVTSTTNVNMTVNTMGTGGQTIDNGTGRTGNGNMGITTEMLDKLMVTSIRSTPNYI